MPPTDPRRVDATPEKRFFISMLVRDIELIPAILDLVDNSIDGAKRLRPDEGEKRFEGLYVRLRLAAEQFRIEDNCGGIPVDHARNYAFRFGRPAGVRGAKDEVGQFGVGMKRALFKLGEAFWIESVAARSSFVLPVDVDAWASTPGTDWSFEFEEVDETAEHPEPERGTTIEVTNLHAPVAEDSVDVAFLRRLRAALELRHQEALQRGIELKLGDDPLDPIVPRLLVGDRISPVHVERALEVDGGSVHMTLYAGFEHGDSNEDDSDVAEPENFRLPSRAGWYFFCNDRLLLAADKTGFGTAVASYHPQYRQFRGYVYLTAEDSSLLPWNTTKTGVDEDSTVYRQARQEMYDALRMVIAVFNRAKDERQFYPPEERPVRMALEAARPVRLADVPLSDTFVAPEAPRRRRAASNSKRISYSVDLADFARVSDEVGSDNGADVGRETFRYYLENEVPEE